MLRGRVEACKKFSKVLRLSDVTVTEQSITILTFSNPHFVFIYIKRWKVETRSKCGDFYQVSSLWIKRF